MKLHHIKLSKAQLDLIPEAERTLLVLLAHAANELSVLTKLFHSCSTYETHTPVETEARNAQSMALGRLLTGKIYECWQLLHSAFFGTKISKSYEPKFDDEAKSSLQALKHYFDGKNLIEAVRNRHAFHYAPDQISRGYAKLADGESLNVYMSETNANTLYAFADTIANYSLVEDINPGNPAEALSSLISDTSKAIGWLNQVIGACMAIAIKTYLGEDLAALGATTVQINGAPDWKAVIIPYFVEIAESEMT